MDYSGLTSAEYERALRMWGEGPATVPRYFPLNRVKASQQCPTLQNPLSGGIGEGSYALLRRGASGLEARGLERILSFPPLPASLLQASAELPAPLGFRRFSSLGRDSRGSCG